jgi:selenoprotein W-related protein
LKRDLGVDIELIASSGGVFEIVADGKLIFSKKELKRFPEDKEVEELIKKSSC